MPDTPVMVYPGWRGVPGVGEGCTGVGYSRVGTGEGYTGTQPFGSQDPYLVLFQPQGPTHGQMKAIPVYFMRFLR